MRKNRTSILVAMALLAGVVTDAGPVLARATVLATGGASMVRAAYGSGTPTIGVGPGNAPAYIERTAIVSKAVHDVIAG